MKKLILILILLSIPIFSQNKLLYTNAGKALISDTADVVRAEFKAVDDSLGNLISLIDAEVDAIPIVSIDYPDANTIQIASGQAIHLDPATLVINGSGQLTVIGGTGGSVGNADSLGGKPASEYLVKNDSTAQRTFSDLKYVDKASTQTITGNKTFSGNKTVFGTTTNDSVAVRGRLQVNNLGIGSKYNLATGTGFMFNKSTMKQQNFTGASLINHISNFDLDATGADIVWGLTGSSGSGLFTYNLEPYGFGINSLYAQPIYIGTNSFMSLGLFPLKTYMEIDSLKFGSLVNNVFTPANKVTIVADTFNFWGTTYINGTKYAPNGSVADADSLGGLPASDYVTKAGINEWSTNLYSGSANVMRLGKSYNDKRFNNGIYSDVWNIDYVVPPYNLSASWLFPIEHRTDYYNDTLQTVSGVANLLKIDGTGTPIWKSSTVTIAGQETQVNIGDLPDSTTLNYSASSTIGNNVILSEENMTASETRYPMQIKGYNFRLGTNNNYILPKLYSYYSDLSTGNIEDGYHFYGNGNYPSYFGGNIYTDGYLRVQDSIIIGTSTVKIYPDSVLVGGVRLAKITEAEQITKDSIARIADASGNIIGLTGKFSNLSNNTIPYNNTSTGLADSRISQDANTTYIRGGNTATSLGSELLTNGTFDTDLSGWTAGAGWGWDSGTAKHTTGNTATLEQSFSTSNNVMYQITVTITNRTAGSITLSFNNGQQNYAGITATGTYHILSTLTGSNKIIITPTTDFNGSMDEVSVKLLTASLPSFILKNTDNSNSGVQIRTGNSANNFYFGIDAGKNNTTGVYNSAIGYQALYSNTIGQLNSAIGYQALRSNTSGYYNSAIGYQALRSNTSGYYNSAIGRDALYSNTTGNYNSAIGRDALYSNTTGNYNSAIGYFALRSIVGQGNIGISYQAGRYNADNSEHTTGNYSNYFGYDTKASTNGVSNENVFGYQAVGMGSNTFVFGSNAITDTYLKGKVHINNDLDVAGYGYFADSIVVGNSTVKIYPDSITIGGIKVNPSGGSGIDTAKVNDLIKDYNDSTGVSIIGTQGTLDSLITDYWNDNLGSGSAWDSTYAYQRITALENDVSALQDTIAYFTNAITSILAALDTCGCSAVVEDNTPPLAPTSYVAIGGTSQTQYVSTWTDPVDADLSKIYWYEGSANDSTTLALVDSINAGVQTYTRTGRTANTTYWSAVKAVDDSGNVSYFSNVDSATTQASSGGIPVIESFTTDSVEASATITLTKPSGVQNGDLLLIVVASDDPTDNQQWNDTTNKPTGFTWLSTTIGGGVGTGQNDCQTHIAVFYRIADGSEGATVGVTSVGTGNDQVGYYLRLSGVYGTSPIDVWDSPLDSTLYQQTDTIQIHSQTTGYDNELALVVCANDGGNYGLTVSGTGWSAVSDNWVNDSEYGLHLIIGKKDMPSAGATGQAIITSSVTTPHGSKVGMILTVRSQ